MENNNYYKAREAQSILVNTIWKKSCKQGSLFSYAGFALCALHNIFASKQGKRMQCMRRKYFVTCHQALQVWTTWLNTVTLHFTYSTHPPHPPQKTLRLTTGYLFLHRADTLESEWYYGTMVFTGVV